jgi:3-oxoacyl-[acyl-carrier protein] reductase
MDARFTGKVVLVTGASRGLGRTIAAAFASEGAHVVVGYRSRIRDAQVTLDEITAAGGKATVRAFDVSDTAATNAAFDQIRSELGAIDVLVNNAGVARDNLIPLMSDEDFDQVVDVNLRGAFICTRAAVKPMIARGGGAIVNVASVAGLRASPGQASYSAAKGGLLALTRTLAAELAPKSIRVNAVVPGYLSTGMAARMDRRKLDAGLANTPLGRAGTADEVARVVLFLASSDASYIVGQAIAVDGGLSL